MFNGSWFSATAQLMVGLNDLKGLLCPKWFYGSAIPAALKGR